MIKKLNKNLHKARFEKNDEFYTQLTDIENELKHYRNHFKDKVVLCNCDCEWSNFIKYFQNNKKQLGIKELLFSGYNKENNTGDFRSKECIQLLKQADIVVTNPPFSLFREYVSQLVEYGKKFIIIGNQNSITYKEVFKLIKDNKIWLGITYPKQFKQPDDSIKTFGNISWFTNLEIKKRHEDLILYKKYNPEEYPHYDNYDAINVDKTKDIPMDWEGAMGVPITFLHKYNPEQFELLGSSHRGGDDFVEMEKIRLTAKKEDSAKIKGQKVYIRLFIKNKKVIK